MRFKEAFLCCDTHKVGTLQGPECACVYQSLGLVLNAQQAENVPAMSLGEFVQYGLNLTKELPADGGLQKLFEAIQNQKTKDIKTVELQEVMALMKNRTPEELEGLMKALDPKGTGKFGCKEFVDVFSK